MAHTINDLTVENSVTLSGGATAAPVAQTPDQANAAGAATSISRSDHVHNIPTAAASGLNANSTNTQGSNTTFAKSDHTHAIASAAAVSISTSSANAAGTSTSFARADHTHAVSNTRYHTETSAGGQVISSATFVDITNATQTAVDAGTYLVIYEGSFNFSNASRTLDIIVNSGGSDVTATQRTCISAAGGQIMTHGTHTVITVTANTVVKMRAQLSSNTVTVNNQALTLVKIA